MNTERKKRRYTFLAEGTTESKVAAERNRAGKRSNFAVVNRSCGYFATIVSLFCNTNRDSA